MSKLEELIRELCPDGVEYEELRNACLPVRTISWGNSPRQTYKYIDLTSVDRVTHSISDTQVINKENAPSRAQQVVKENDVILGTTRPTLKRYCSIPVEYDGHICSTGFCVIRANLAFILPRFIYHVISTVDFQNYVELNQKGSAYPSISNSDVFSYIVPLPPLPVQEEIVRILDKFTALEAELEARKKQYGYYLNMLLSHETKYIPQNTVEWCSISEAFHFLNGYTPSTSDPTFWEDGTIPWFRMEDIRTNGRILSDSIQHITRNAVKGLLFPANSIILAISATIGEHALLTTESLSNQRFVCLAIKAEYLDKIDIKYFFYYCFLIDQWCLENTTLGNFLSVDMGKLRKLKIPLPSLSVQKRIASILDRFDALVSDITQGLPAELAARRRQYEYYRDKLLTFKEKVS